MDLNAPLGMTPPPRRRRSAILLVGGVITLTAFGAVAFVLAGADPHGGRPYVVADLPPPPAPPPPAPITLDRTPTGSVAVSGAPADASSSAASVRGNRSGAGSLEGGVMVYRGMGAGQGAAAPIAAAGPLMIDVTRAIDDPLGKARSASAAKPGASASATPVQPRVAIFVSGMGLDAGATRTAIETMPAEITLAFLPYGPAVTANVGAAKAKGHEVLLQLPMRNEGGSSPGPHALRPDDSAEVIGGDLAWLMDRFAGYDGVANMLGAPVTADTAAMTLVLKAAGARHLYYLDDGTSRRSVAEGLAPNLGVEVVKTDLVLDATSDPAVVRANLDQLVAIAKRKGSAVGMASGLPEHLGTISRFVAGLAVRGVELVPVRTLAHAGDPTQAAAAR